MAYQLDKWQHIVGINMKVLPADYAVCYARLDPPYSTLVGYAAVTSPALSDIQGTRDVNSVGDWPEAIIPRGSENRSYPEGGNGKAEEGKDGALATRLPSLEELEGVYIWHVGRSHAWGISDQIIVNVKKLKEDFPDRGSFAIGMASHTWAAVANGDGAILPWPDGIESPRQPLRLYVGLRTYVGDGGSFEFAPVTTKDPFNQSVEIADIAHYHGGKAEMSANFEMGTATEPITVYGQFNIFTLRGMNWDIAWKHPKQSALSAGSISTQEA